MTKTTDKSTASEADIVAGANEEIATLQKQLAELTQRNTELTTDRDELVATLDSAREENADLLKINAALREAPHNAPGAADAVPTIDHDAIPEDVHLALSHDAEVVANARITNGLDMTTIRRKLVDEAHRLGRAILEPFHKPR